jgi:CheY-like chemotaxis protein
VLSDLFMPDVDGLEVIREVQRNFPGVGIVAVSGGGSRDGLDLLLTAHYLGADAILYKPFDVGPLLDAVGRAREKAGARDGTNPTGLATPTPT